MKKIVTIVVTYNAMEWIDKCITSLQKSSVHTDVIVVDNASFDGSRSYIPNHYPQVIWCPQDENLGFGRANNIGLKYALENDYDYILLLNQDAYVFPNTLEILLQWIDETTLLSPIQLRGDGVECDLRFRINTVERNADTKTISQERLLQLPPYKYEVNEIPAACWFVSTNVIRHIGGFNPLFFHYAEDTNFLHRLQYHHYHIGFISGAYVCHDRPQIYTLTLNKQRIYQQLVLYAVNINDSPVKRFAHVVRYGLSLLKRSLLEGEPFVFDYCSSLYTVLKQTKLLCQNRIMEQKQQTNWL